MDGMSFLRISSDFIDFHGCQGSEVRRRVAAFAIGMLQLKSSLLESQLAAISPIFLRFHDFSGFSWNSGVRGLETSCGVCPWNVAPKDSLLDSQLAAISSIHRLIGSGGWLAAWLDGCGGWERMMRRQDSKPF